MTLRRLRLNRSPQGRLLVILGCLLAVALAVAVNVATGGSLPGLLGRYRSFAWPTVGFLTVCSSVVAILQLKNKAVTQGSSPIRLPITNLPPRNPYFSGREVLLATLRRNFNAKRSITVLTSGKRLTQEGSGEAQALYGLGGVGKTQLALEYAYMHAREYAIRWWIASDFPSQIPTGLAALARALGITGDENELVMSVLLELARRNDWLVIFDNAVNPHDILPYIPTSGGGHILVTSRNPAWAGLGKLLEVDVFSRQESVAVLRRRIDRVSKSIAEKLAEELGDLALALEQAAAYMQETNLSPEEYLHLLLRSRGRLIDRGMPVLYGQTVAVTFGLAYDKIAAESPAATQLLELCAFLAPDYIPTSQFLRFPDLLPNELSVLARDELLFNDVIGVVRRYSLIAIDRGRWAPGYKDFLRIHRLVQTVIANKLNPLDKESRLKCVLLLLNSTMAKDYTMLGYLTGDEPQALVVVDLAQDFPGLKELATELLYTVGRNYESGVKRPLSVPILERALLSFEELYGPDHPKVAAVLMNLGLAMLDLHRLEKSRNHLVRGLRIMEAQDPDSLDLQGGELTRILRFNLERRASGT